ncbi:MAG: hypothetical protein IH588_11565 [Anaerolineales bacterium]|nr:hypothetical protein [Anaerolineales bacterium]
MKFLEDIKEWAVKYSIEEKIKDLYPLFDSFDKQFELFNALKNDAIFVNNLLKQDSNNQYLRRIFIKTTFSVIEGYLNVLNQSVLDLHKYGKVQLTKQEIEQLEEIQERKDKKIPKFMPFNKKVRFSLETYARKVGGFEYLIDTNTAEWKNFEASILIRHRLTHPHKTEDLIIGEQELGIILDASNWFLDVTTNLYKKVGEESTRQSLERIKKARTNNAKRKS